MGHLDSVRVAKLVRGESPANARSRGEGAQPRVDLLPSPPIHADLASLAALALTDLPRDRSRSLSASATASLMRKPARQRTTGRARVLRP